MRSADEQKRDRTTSLHGSKLSPCSQTSNAGLFHRSSSVLRQTITLCKTCIRDAVYRNAAKDCLFIRVGVLKQLSDEWVLRETILSWSNGLSTLGFNADL